MAQKQLDLCKQREEMFFSKSVSLGGEKKEKLFSFEDCEENGENVLHTLKWD